MKALLKRYLIHDRSGSDLHDVYRENKSSKEMLDNDGQHIPTLLMFCRDAALK